jgi:hypothetical protein
MKLGFDYMPFLGAVERKRDEEAAPLHILLIKSVSNQNEACT